MHVEGLMNRISMIASTMAFPALNPNCLGVRISGFIFDELLEHFRGRIRHREKSVFQRQLGIFSTFGNQGKPPRKEK